jgi:cbb3-type cytochrome oxidase subunit 3
MSQFFKDYNLEWLPPAMVIIFFAIFLYIVVNVFRKSDKDLYEEASKLPLNQDEGVSNEHS